MNADPTRIDIELDPRTLRFEGVARHGMTPFSVPYISHITENLWVGGCMDGLALPEEIVHVVSLYRWESYRLHRDVRTALTVTMYDAEGEVDGATVKRLARWVNECLDDGPTLVHCQAGLNRSNLVAATALIQRGMGRGHAIDLLRERRSPAVLCNTDFAAWVLEEAT